VLRHRRVAQIKQVRQFAYRALPLDQLANDHQPVRIGKRLVIAICDFCIFAFSRFSIFAICVF
jgi:hypothetical protein